MKTIPPKTNPGFSHCLLVSNIHPNHKFLIELKNHHRGSGGMPPNSFNLATNHTQNPPPSGTFLNMSTHKGLEFWHNEPVSMINSKE